jgi:nucleolar protein 12
MAEKIEKSSKADKVEKKSRKSKEDRESKKKEKSKDKGKDKDKDKNKSEAKIAKAVKNGLLADSTTVDQNLASLFAVIQPPVKAALPQAKVAEEDDEEEEVDDDAELSSIDGDIDEAEDDVEDQGENGEDTKADMTPAAALAGDATDGAPKRKRKRNDGDELEDAYMRKLTREEDKDAAKAAADRAAKRQRANGDDAQDAEAAEMDEDADSDAEMEDVTDDEDVMSPPPKHETQSGPAPDDELLKANRTVFLANVSTDAITSKSSRKALMTHLASFFTDLPTPKADAPKPKVESLRFRSTPYAAAIPKKAAYAKKELMDATTKSTNAYAVYSTPALAREACQRLNGTVVLSRHLRVDSVAHPAKIDNHRCIFVGNLGFVDDETNIQDANEEEGREVRKRGKEPADIEEGLWRTFAKCGNVESVRVIRDSTTRVGKGIAYVQFEDENAVEAALQYNEKKFPPMLPRKLRVSRAKAVKRNAKPGSGRPTTNKARPTGYQRKFTAEEQSSMGRTSKLFGRAAAAKQAKEPKARGTAANTTPLGEAGARGKSVLGEGIRKPESFIFEGHRARSTGGKAGLKLGGKKKGTKVTGRSKAFKSKAKAKAGGK